MNYLDALINSYEKRYSEVNQDDEFYYLYKHFSYGDKDTEWEFKVLNTFYNSCLLYSKPNEFNDPFDCFSIVDYDFSKIKKNELEQILKIRMTNKEFKLRKDFYIRQLKGLPEIKNWGDVRRNGFHLTCFNSSPLHILMWSHYAYNHQGFMIEFKFKKKLNDYTHLPVPVNYSNDFPHIKYPYNASAKMCLLNSDFGAEALIKLFSNKAECWSYENEFRMLNTKMTLLDPKAPVEIESDLFANVIFGNKANERCISETEKAIDTFNKKYGKTLKTYKAEMKKDKYELYVPNHPRLDQ